MSDKGIEAAIEQAAEAHVRSRGEEIRRHIDPGLWDEKEWDFSLWDAEMRRKEIANARAAVVAFLRSTADDPSLNGGPIAAWLDAEADRLEADQ